MNWLEQMTPLHDRILVRHLERKQKGSIILIRENPDMVDMVGEGENGQHDDNRRVFIVSKVQSCGGSVRGIKKGDVIYHTAWNDFPEYLQQQTKGYALIRQNDIAGHYHGSAYEA